jgi:peptidoglycan-N-acetylglucosamine deacetylase
MARRVATLVCFALAAGLIFGALGMAVSRMEAEASKHPAAAPRPATPIGTPSPATPIGTPSLATTPARSDGKVVYLTFDDGPDPRWTPEVLELLARYDAKATFFMLGRNAVSNPALVARVRAEGHAIGNHSVSHKYLPGLSSTRMRNEITGGVGSRCFRPPYGATNTRVRNAVRAAGMRQVLWDVDPRDWSRPGSTAIAGRVLSQVYNGRVVLMHDGGGDRSQTVTALDRILRTLTARGFSFRSIFC